MYRVVLEKEKKGGLNNWNRRSKEGYVCGTVQYAQHSPINF